jgi:hypothetical protein
MHFRQIVPPGKAGLPHDAFFSRLLVHVPAPAATVVAGGFLLYPRTET